MEPYECAPCLCVGVLVCVCIHTYTVISCVLVRLQIMFSAGALSSYVGIDYEDRIENEDSDAKVRQAATCVHLCVSVCVCASVCVCVTAAAQQTTRECTCNQADDVVKTILEWMPPGEYPLSFSLQAIPSSQQYHRSRIMLLLLLVANRLHDRQGCVPEAGRCRPRRLCTHW